MKCKDAETKTSILEKIGKYAKWENYSSTAARGWSSLTKEKLETVLYNEEGFSKEDVEVINANLGLWMIH